MRLHRVLRSAHPRQRIALPPRGGGATICAGTWGAYVRTYTCVLGCSHTRQMTDQLIDWYFAG
jgi:hypothetical protein